MGTQQILLIVLSVIIVGVAIAVGITMFRNQAVNSNAQQLAAEATNIRNEIVQWYKTPADQGGAGRTVTTANIEALYTRVDADGTGLINKPNIGKFQIYIVGAATEASIGALGVEKRGTDSPTFLVNFDLASGEVVGTATPGFGTDIPAPATAPEDPEDD